MILPVKKEWIAVEKKRSTLIFGSYQIDAPLELDINEAKFIAALKGEVTGIIARPKEPIVLSDNLNLNLDFQGKVATAEAKAGIEVELLTGKAQIGFTADATAFEGAAALETEILDTPIKMTFTGKLISGSIGATIGTKEIKGCFAPGVGGCIGIKIGTEVPLIKGSLYEVQ